MPLDHWTAAEREMQSGMGGSLLQKAIGQLWQYMMVAPILSILSIGVSTRSQMAEQAVQPISRVNGLTKDNGQLKGRAWRDINICLLGSIL